MKKDLLYYINELKAQVKRNFDYYTQIQNLNLLLVKKDKEINELKNRLQKQINLNNSLIKDNTDYKDKLDKLLEERRCNHLYNKKDYL